MRYKYQPCLEKRHFLGKSVLEMAPVFLKKNTRIEALRFVCFIAQLIAALMERTIRQNMARRKIKAIPSCLRAVIPKRPLWRKSWTPLPRAPNTNFITETSR
ncbi:hypothetical protein SBV1_1890037 [Verrucomicrobia bacterium]|nr:hypothetical protein SBV1_1890037 [Verrucomicrobiota bacterium]